MQYKSKLLDRAKLQPGPKAHAHTQSSSPRSLRSLSQNSRRQDPVLCLDSSVIHTSHRNELEGWLRAYVNCWNLWPHFISLRFCHDSTHGNFSKERAFRAYPRPTVETLEEGSAGNVPWWGIRGLWTLFSKAYGDKMSVGACFSDSIWNAFNHQVSKKLLSEEVSVVGL